MSGGSTSPAILPAMERESKPSRPKAPKCNEPQLTADDADGRGYDGRIVWQLPKTYVSARHDEIPGIPYLTEVLR
jgi:hypothetical protein